MIGLVGQYVIVAQLGDNDSFLTDDNLAFLEMHQKAGGELPQFALDFITDDPSVLRMLNEGNTLTIKIGRTLDELVETKWRMSFPRRTHAGTSGYRVNLSGVLETKGYVTSQRTKIHKGTSEQAIGAAASSSGFSFVGDTSAADTMNWIQPSTTDFEFIQESYVRYYGTGDSCAAVAVTYDNDFRMYDLRKVAKAKQRSPDWKLQVFDSAAGNEVTIQPAFSVSSGSGFMNQWAGFGISVREHNWKTGVETDIAFNRSSDPIYQSVGATAKLNRNSSEPPRYLAPVAITPENVHANWSKAHATNLSWLALASTTTVECSFANTFVNIKPLDVVIFHDSEIDSSKADDSSNFADSGQYTVQFVGVRYEDKQIGTTVVLSRDAVGELTGSIS